MEQATIAKLVWAIADKKDVLWLKWIHGRYLKRFAASRNTLKWAVHHHFPGNGRGAYNTQLANAISSNSHPLIR